MIISHKHKFIFICNPKTGTTSLELALEGYNEVQFEEFGSPHLFGGKHIPPAILKAVLPASIWHEYFKFVFVRHPLDWCVSQCKYNFRDPGRISIKRLCFNPFGLPEYLKTYRAKKIRSQKTVFDEYDIDFVHRHLKCYRGMPQTESLLQSSYIYDADGNQIVDFVGRFETLQDSIEQIKDKLGIQFEMPHLNRTSRGHYTQCLTHAAIDKVYQLWAEDFKNLGYPMAVEKAMR